jgi:quercetin dioxygenase-like cupin family protein
MNAHVAVGRLGELPQIRGGEPTDPAGWTPVRHLLGVKAFGVNAWHGDEGQLVIEEHDELPDNDAGGHEELYLVVGGHARFVIGGDQLDAPAGTVVVVPPNVRRVAHAAADATTVLVVGAPRGEAFTPSAWEDRAIERAGLY